MKSEKLMFEYTLSDCYYRNQFGCAAGVKQNYIRVKFDPEEKMSQ